MSYPALAYAPAAPAPHGYVPHGSAPNGSVPNGSAPGGSLPGGYAPGGQTPYGGAAARVVGTPRPAARLAGAYAPPAAPAAATGARYRDAELAAAAPGQLVVMLFDKCLLTVRRAGAAFVAGDVEARVGHLCRAADMVTELRGALDLDAPGAAGGISRQLDALYAWTLGELFAANRTQAPARLDPVLRVLGDLRDAFAGAQAQLAAEDVARHATAAPAVALLARSA